MAAAKKARPIKRERQLYHDVIVVREELFVVTNFRGRLQNALDAAGRKQGWLCKKLGIAPQTYQSMVRLQKTIKEKLLAEIERHVGVDRAYWTADQITTTRMLAQLRRESELRRVS